ncbi:hypothetical protein VTJ49DRAFT_2463 [Mycothermus thermophilus]|uniref:non-specific serine/threonine protein kinase n=1 Tax=Humicola insolens TaxID=85995 RepID=A0ABR3VA84_HUMIN
MSSADIEENPTTASRSEERSANPDMPANTGVPSATPYSHETTEPSSGMVSASQSQEAPANDEDPLATPREGEPAETAPDPGDIDEGRDAYRPGWFHPVYIGDVYADKYHVLNKIGYGGYSTVWLVKDLTKKGDDEHKYLAMKVLCAVACDEKNPLYAREILKHLRDGDRKLVGYKHICHLVDDFEHHGPNGTHVCLIFELMGETMQSFGAWFKESRIPYSVMRRFTFQIMCALDYAHHHNVIHTDVQPANIFVKFRDRSLIESRYLAEVPVPQQDRSEPRYTPIPSTPLRYDYFNEEQSKDANQFQFALGDWGVASWKTKHLTENIQPVALRAPEVLIGAPWDEAVDWWSFGALLLELYRTVRMFEGRVPPDGHYEVKKHLGQIVQLFGPFPKDLLEKGNQELVQDIFDDEGKINDPFPGELPPLNSEEYMPGADLDQEDRDLFASFLRAIMKINPADRPEAKDLLSHPWLGVVLRNKAPDGKTKDEPNRSAEADKNDDAGEANEANETKEDGKCPEVNNGQEPDQAAKPGKAGEADKTTDAEQNVKEDKSQVD